MLTTLPASSAVGPFWNFTIVLSVQAASAVVSGLPSDHLAPALVWNVQVRPSEDSCQLVAKSGSIWSLRRLYWTRYGYMASNESLASVLLVVNGFSDAMVAGVPSRR